MQPIFKFKDDEYTFKELFSMALTKKNIYQQGEVVNLQTGEIFDISEIYQVKTKYYELLNDITNTVGNIHDNRIRWAIEQESKENTYNILKEKYDKKSITLDEMFDYLKLKKELDSNFLKNRSMFSISYDSYITLNIGERLPKDLKMVDKGRFYEMLYFLSYDNKLKKTPRKNGRAVKKEELMEVLELTNYNSFRKFMCNLAKLNVLTEVSTTNKTKVVILNPIYATTSDFTLEQYHIDLFGEEVFKLYYFTTKDIQVIEKYRHLLSDLEYKKMSFKLNPSENYIVFNEAIIDCGIYLLYNDENIVYIGKSNNMKNRIKQHKKDKEFSNVKCIIFTDEGLVNLYEPYLIQKYKPMYNKDLLEDIKFELPEIKL